MKRCLKCALIIKVLCVTALTVFLFAGCFSALAENDEGGDGNGNNGGTPLTDTAVSSDGGPLVLVHYMPWYQAPPVDSGYGYHWAGGGGYFNPSETLADGRADIASRQYPLTGPYDSRDIRALEYQAALMKLAGIDGVIFDWYGIHDVYDYGPIHESALAMAEVIKRAGLKFAVCYEDQTIPNIVNVKGLSALDAGREVFSWLQENWFYDDAYVRYQGRPVVLCFGPQYYSKKSDWDAVFSVTNPRPLFADLDNRTGWADTSYNWPPMWASSNGVLSITRLKQYLQDFNNRQKNRACRIATVFPAFDDIYGDMGGSSYGYLDYAEGETFRVTFEAAESIEPQLIQAATWNDYGEGTIIEPTIERGYGVLEYLQDKQREWNPDFPYTHEELRIPIELFRLNSAAAKGAYEKLFADDTAGFREAVEQTGISFDLSVKPVLRN